MIGKFLEQIISNPANLIAMFSLLVALLASEIALRQAYINREKLRLDLYDKRFKVYTNVLNIYQQLIKYIPSTESQDKLESIHIDFIMTLHESTFLFDKSSGIFELLVEMNDKVFLIKGHKEHGQKIARIDPKVFTKYHEEFQQSLNWFGREGINKLQILLEPYLNFHKIKSISFWGW